MLASDGTALIYNTKQKIWSMLPKCSHADQDEALTVVNYKGRITAVTKRPHRNPLAVDFDSELGKWQESQVATPSGNETISLTVTDNKLYACKGDKLQSLSDEGWKVEHELQSARSTSSQTKILATEKEFIITGRWNGIYRQLRQPATERATKKTLKQIANPTHNRSTLHFVKDQLFAFGGMDKENQPTSDVQRYNTHTNSWEDAGYMRNARYDATVVTVQKDGITEVLVMGGQYSGPNFCYKVEKCVVP